jgi:SAM-dependent methyltransferase
MPGRLDPLRPWLPPVLFNALRHAAALLRRRLKPVHLVHGEVFQPEDIAELHRVFLQSGMIQGSDWDRHRHSHMPLPSWFVKGLDPWGEDYRAQQVRLWQLITGVDRDYSPETDEQEAQPAEMDVLRQPGFYARRDALAISSASDHILATGMLLKHCNLQAGDLALEYGAGFAQTALALARLGVQVDTVDISANFCRWVQEQADFFQVPLRPHQGRFGMNPRPGQRYKLIWFYESFHHCLDFQDVVPQIEGMLAEGGRIILGGEPTVEVENAAVPYPWGVRLHSEVAAVMRHTRWFELGFTEAFLYELFARSGLVGRRVDCEPSLWGRLYIFERADKKETAQP